MKITHKEQQAMDAFRHGMDEPNCGWLHEIAPFSGRQLSGIVSSLVRKGLISCTREIINQDTTNVCHWIQVLPVRQAGSPAWVL